MWKPSRSVSPIHIITANTQEAICTALNPVRNEAPAELQVTTELAPELVMIKAMTSLNRLHKVKVLSFVIVGM